MKRFFLYAVAIAALCSSCETEDETFSTETNNQTNALHQAKGVKANDYETYQSILNSFEYNHQPKGAISKQAIKYFLMI
ncbi:MAG TPA: hypothetical protein VLY87_06730 [Flavobacterium sp.]|nr:hypothetical protein [Flavobacterium sp.]